MQVRQSKRCSIAETLHFDDSGECADNFRYKDNKGFTSQHDPEPHSSKARDVRCSEGTALMSQPLSRSPAATHADTPAAAAPASVSPKEAAAPEKVGCMLSTAQSFGHPLTCTLRPAPTTGLTCNGS